MTKWLISQHLSYLLFQKTEQPDAATLKKELLAGSDAAISAPAASDATPLDCLIKHPLQNQWTLWYYDNEKNKNWEACQHQITGFDTVEDFWSLYNHIKPASEIKNGNDYSLFKNGIRPMWEDDTNKNGGRWVISLTKYFRSSDVDRLWLDVILCLIGEGFDYSEDICGAVVNIRPRGHKICKYFLYFWFLKTRFNELISVLPRLFLNVKSSASGST